MSATSPANSRPMRRPKGPVPSRRNMGSPRSPHQSQTRAAATSERSPAPIRGEIPATPTLIATWFRPQARQQSSRRATGSTPDGPTRSRARGPPPPDREQDDDGAQAQRDAGPLGDTRTMLELHGRAGHHERDLEQALLVATGRERRAGGAGDPEGRVGDGQSHPSRRRSGHGDLPALSSGRERLGGAILEREEPERSYARQSPN